MSAIQAEIEARLAEAEPEVEVLLAEVVGGKLVRLFIDHPSGVSLELCERVTKHLPAVREKYARPSASRIEVFSGSRSRAFDRGTVAELKSPASRSAVPRWNRS